MSSRCSPIFAAHREILGFVGARGAFLERVARGFFEHAEINAVFDWKSAPRYPSVDGQSFDKREG